MYELLGISLGLASLLTINALASVAAAACWRFGQGLLHTRSARTRAETLFAMRIAPPALALIFVTSLLLPSYIRHEPYATAEVVSKKLAALAILSAIGVTFALWRAWRSSLATRSLRREWLSNAVPIKLEGTSIPTFRICSAFPIIAVVGVLKPRLFVAGQVLESLNEVELAAAIAHECGHLATHDNLKRSLLRFCRDVLMIVPCGRSLDRAWAQAAECAADEHAARKDSETALNLASGLVKIARMVPLGAHAAVPMAAFLVGVEESGVKARVRRLLEIAADGCRHSVPDITVARVVPVTPLALLLCLALAGAGNPRVLFAVHTMIEHAVRILS